VRLELTRILSQEDGTFGVLRGPGLLLFTAELPWADNAPERSRIPPGSYTLEPHHTERFPACWALVGVGVAHFPAPGVTRSAVLIHAANLPTELRGCIAPGRYLGQLDGRLAVLRSRDAMADLRVALPRAQAHALEIAEAIR
jgi:hypothetical protein